MHPLGLCNNNDEEDLYEYGWVGVVKLEQPELDPSCLTVLGKVSNTARLYTNKHDAMSLGRCWMLNKTLWPVCIKCLRVGVLIWDQLLYMPENITPSSYLHGQIQPGSEVKTTCVQQLN